MKSIGWTVDLMDENGQLTIVQAEHVEENSPSTPDHHNKVFLTTPLISEA